MNPLVTIAIPTYRRLAYLQEAVASALNQTYSEIEVLISQDPTPGGLDEPIHVWCQQITERDSRVRYRSNERNLGLAGNWNASVAAAQGEYVVLIGDDDRLCPAFVERLISQAPPGCDVIFANHYLIDDQGKLLQVESEQATATYCRHRLSPGLLADPEAWAWQNAIPMLSALVRTELLRTRPFPENLNTPEIVLFIQLAQAGCDFFFVPDYLAEYRLHAQSATGSGLRTEKLVACLVEIKTTPSMEAHKARLLAPMLPNAVSRSMLAGDVEQARKFLQSVYYPPEKLSLTSVVQNFCAILPPRQGVWMYELFHRAKRLSRV